MLTLTRRDNTTNQQPSVRLVPAVVQTMKLLRAIAATPRGLTVTAASRETAISQSTCFNLLRTLVHERVLNFDPEAKTYTLGLGLAEVTAAIQDLGTNDVVRPELVRIAAAHDALVTLWEIIDDERMVLLERVAGPRAVRIEIRIGQRLPLLSGAVGRCVAAHLGLSPRRLRKQFDALNWESAPTFESFVRDMERCKADGYALDCGHWLRGINAVGSVVLDAHGRPRMGIGALTITGHLNAAALRLLGADLFAARRLIEKTLSFASTR